MIHFQNVTKRYATGQDALKQVSFELAKGEMAFLTGHSGAGKSTLLKLITLTERHSYGQIIIDDHNLAKIKHNQIPKLRRSMGVILQNPMLLPERDVFHNVAMPLIIKGVPHKTIGSRVRAALDMVGLLRKERMLPLALSAGEQQRVSIARAIVHKPLLILADEPTGNLDPTLSLEIMKLFAQFNEVGTSILVATHDLGLVARMPYRVLTLKEGKLV